MPNKPPLIIPAEARIYLRTLCELAEGLSGSVHQDYLDAARVVRGLLTEPESLVTEKEDGQ